MLFWNINLTKYITIDLYCKGRERGGKELRVYSLYLTQKPVNKYCQDSLINKKQQKYIILEIWMQIWEEIGMCWRWLGVSRVQQLLFFHYKSFSIVFVKIILGCK